MPLLEQRVWNMSDPVRMVGSMAERSSLDLLLEINQAERQAQLGHFDSLDTKAGLVLGFASVLIALGSDAETIFSLASVI